MSPVLQQRAIRAWPIAKAEAKKIARDRYLRVGSGEDHAVHTG